MTAHVQICFRRQVARAFISNRAVDIWISPAFADRCVVLCGCMQFDLSAQERFRGLNPGYKRLEPLQAVHRLSHVIAQGSQAAHDRTDALSDGSSPKKYLRGNESSDWSRKLFEYDHLRRAKPV